MVIGDEVVTGLFMGINEGNKTRIPKVRGLSSGNVAEGMKMIRVNIDGG